MPAPAAQSATEEELSRRTGYILIKDKEDISETPKTDSISEAVSENRDVNEQNYATNPDLTSSVIKQNQNYYNNNLYQDYESNVTANNESQVNEPGPFGSNIRDVPREESSLTGEDRKRPSEFDVNKAGVIPEKVNQSFNAVKVSEKNSQSTFYDQEDGEEQEGDDFNLKSTIAHLQGDLVYSVGVFVSAVIINLFPNLRFMDSLCTLLFSYVAVELTFPIFAESSRILLEGISDGTLFLRSSTPTALLINMENGFKFDKSWPE